MNRDPHQPADGALHILGIAGSLRAASHTRRAVEIALDGARDSGAKATLIDLRDWRLPFCTGHAPDADAWPDAARLRQEVQSAAGFILGTPEYHGSFSGVLKNALDLTELEDWRGKVIALVGVSGGSAGPANAASGLRSVGRGLDAWVLPRQVLIPSAHKAFDEASHNPSPDVHKRLLDLGRELAAFARLHARHRSSQ